MGLATIRANSAREALVKRCTLPLLAGEIYPARKRGLWAGTRTLPLFGSHLDPGVDTPTCGDRRRT